MPQLQSNQITHSLFNENDLRKLTFPRLKKFRGACYRHDTFWCCEFRCERHWANSREEEQYATYVENMHRINKVLSEKTPQIKSDCA